MDPPQSVADLEPVQRAALAVHAKDLLTVLAEQQPTSFRARRRGHGRVGKLQLAQRSPTLAFLNLLFSSVADFITALAANPLLPITSPITFIYTITAMALLTVGLSIANVALLLFDKLGGYTLVALISKDHAQGFSLVNMGDPGMFSRKDTLVAVKAASKAMSRTLKHKAYDTKQHQHAQMAKSLETAAGGKEYHAQQHPKINKVGKLGGFRTVDLDLDIAKTLLLLSALVYERKEAEVAAAANFPHWAPQKLFASEQRIHDVAATYNLRFCSISDFTSVSGSFTGAFYPNSGPAFIIVAMKGTTPSNFNEFLVDSNIGHIDASSHLFGACHEGFYSTLFPSQSSGTAVNPYRRICETVQAIAKELIDTGRATHNDKIPLWVTGHSLGAALASILYTRFLFEQGDLGKHIELRDAFVYGCPRLGDAKFCAEFENLMEKPENMDRQLWRICNEQDIVAKVPPGVADEEDRRVFLKPASLLNYGFIGTSFHLDGRAPIFYRVDPKGVRVGDTIHVTESPSTKAVAMGKAGYAAYPTSEGGSTETTSTGATSSTTANIVVLVSLLMKYAVPWLRDHFPSRYFSGLSKVSGLEVTDVSVGELYLSAASAVTGARTGNATADVQQQRKEDASSLASVTAAPQPSARPKGAAQAVEGAAQAIAEKVEKAAEAVKPRTDTDKPVANAPAAGGGGKTGQKAGGK